MGDGFNETNPLPKGFHDDFNPTRTVSWKDPELKEVVRLRFLSDPGYPYWDVSYCYGVMNDGTHVRVELPFSDIPKYQGSIWSQIKKYAAKDGVNPSRLKIYNAISTLN